MRTNTANQKGFSLLEMLIVALIIAIIAGIAIPSYLASRRATREQLDIVKLGNIGAAANSFKRTAGQNRYPTLGELNDPLPGQTTPFCAITQNGSTIGLTTRSVDNEWHRFENLDTPTGTIFSAWMVPYKDGAIDYSRPTYAVFEDGKVRSNNQPYPNVPSRTSPAVNR